MQSGEDVGVEVAIEKVPMEVVKRNILSMLAMSLS
jgi:hypothetical protein